MAKNVKKFRLPDDENAIQELIAQLRKRETDPEFCNAPIIDVYARISVYRDWAEGESEKTSRQIKDVLQAMIRTSYRLGVVMRDDNQSANHRNGKRKGYSEIRRRMIERESQGVFCWHTDRLLRHPWDLEELIEFSENGYIVKSVFGQYNLSDSDQCFTLRILTAKAKNESDGISRRRKARYAADREKGIRHFGRRAFGQPGRMRNKKGAMVAVSDELVRREREALARAVRARVNGAKINEIVRMWNEENLLTTCGNPWTNSSVAKTLKVASHAGILTFKGKACGEITNNPFEPVITSDEFNTIQTASAEKGPLRRKTLSGLVLCARCGTKMVSKTRRARWTYYSCPSPYARPNACGKNNVPALDLENVVRDMVLDRLSDPLHAQMIMRQSQELAAIERQIAAREKALKAAATKAGNDIGDDEEENERLAEEWKEFKKPIEDKLRELKLTRKALKDAGANGERQVTERKELSALWEEATMEEKHRLTLKAFPYRLTVLPAKFGTPAWKKPVASRIQENVPAVNVAC